MRTLIILLLSLTVFISCRQQVEEAEFNPLEYGIFFGENEQGFFKSELAEDGTYRYVFEYNDRGRGPHLEESIKLDKEGVIESLEILGHNYLKDTVAEKFNIEDQRASWNSRTESGSAETGANTFYVGVNSAYGNTELLVRKMLRSSDRSVDLYPSGNLKISDSEWIEVSDSLRLNLIELVGFSFTPTYVWFDEHDRFFAAPSSWLSCIRKGHESISEKLLEIQTNKEKEYYANTAVSLTNIPEGRVLISNVNLFDSKTGTVLPNRNVVLNGNKIESVSEGSENLAETTTIIDGTDKTLLPGLFDMHTHLGRSDGILNLAGGVTSVRDLANSFDLPEIGKEFNENKVIGPRILIMSGFIDQAGPYAGPAGKIITSLEEGLEAIDFYKERGYQQIKLYSSIDPEWVQPMAEKAHELGLRVSGHIPAYMLAEQAVEAGYDEIQHINMIALNFMSDTIDTRTPLRFSMIGEHAHDIDLDGEEFRDFVQLLKKENIVVDPTVSIFEGMLTSVAGQPEPMFEEILDRLPIQIKRQFYSGGLPIPEGKEDQYKASYQKLLEMVQVLHESGITLVPGTDAMSGFGLHKEMENYVRAGIPAAEVLQMATITSAKVVGQDEKLGSLEEGKLADLILIDGNPLDNISDIRRVELTIKDGKLYYPAQLYEAIGVAHYE